MDTLLSPSEIHQLKHAIVSHINQHYFEDTEPNDVSNLAQANKLHNATLSGTSIPTIATFATND